AEERMRHEVVGADRVDADAGLVDLTPDGDHAFLRPDRVLFVVVGLEHPFERRKSARARTAELLAPRARRKGLQPSGDRRREPALHDADGIRHDRDRAYTASAGWEMLQVRLDAW